VRGLVQGKGLSCGENRKERGTSTGPRQELKGQTLESLKIKTPDRAPLRKGARKTVPTERQGKVGKENPFKEHSGNARLGVPKIHSLPYRKGWSHRDRNDFPGRKTKEKRPTRKVKRGETHTKPEKSGW